VCVLHVLNYQKGTPLIYDSSSVVWLIVGYLHCVTMVLIYSYWGTCQRLIFENRFCFDLELMENRHCSRSGRDRFITNPFILRWVRGLCNCSRLGKASLISKQYFWLVTSDGTLVDLWRICSCGDGIGGSPLMKPTPIQPNSRRKTFS